MKYFYLTTIVFLQVFNFVDAQESGCFSLCKYDLLNGPFPFDDMPQTQVVSYAKPGGITNSCYHDVKYKDDQSDCGIIEDDCDQNTNDLFYKVYYPSGYTKQKFYRLPFTLRDSCSWRGICRVQQL